MSPNAEMLQLSIPATKQETGVINHLNRTDHQYTNGVICHQTCTKCVCVGGGTHKERGGSSGFRVNGAAATTTELSLCAAVTVCVCVGGFCQGKAG